MARVHTLIRFDHVSFSYHSRQLVLSDISFMIDKGQFVCLLGSNASGKSTLAKLVDALLLPTQGTITVAGYNTDEETTIYDLRKNIGMVFQNPDDQLIATLVQDDVAFALENLGIPACELQQRIGSALKAVELDGFEKRSTTALSGGEKQRLALAGALAIKPKLLVLDEPTSMLDAASKKTLLDILHKLHKQGTSILMITHDIEEALGADRIMLLHKGKLLFDGKPDSLLEQNALFIACNQRKPFALQLSEALQAQGLSVSATMHENALLEELLCLAANT